MLESAKKRKWRGGPLGTPRALKRPESGWGATQAKRRRTEITRSLWDPGVAQKCVVMRFGARALWSLLELWRCVSKGALESRRCVQRPWGLNIFTRGPGLAGDRVHIMI